MIKEAGISTQISGENLENRISRCRPSPKHVDKLKVTARRHML